MTRRAGWLRTISAIAGYELRFFFRRKKIIGAVTIILVFSALTFILGPLYETQYFGASPNHNAAVSPHYDFAFGGEAGFLVLSVVMAIDSISGEFEKGDLEMLLTKPVSRGEVYLGKLTAGAIVLLAAVSGAVLVDIPFATIVYGPQSDLLIMLAYVLGWFFTGLVFLTMVYAIASFTRSTALTVVIAFVYWTVVYSVPSVASLWFMDLLPGWGAGLSQPGVGSGVAGIGSLLVYYLMHPAGQVTYQGSEILIPVVDVLTRALAIGAMYFSAFLALGYYSFKRAQLS